jgi:GT2 family glycosyltransferase
MTAVSVVVATRNRPAELADCLGSLLAQTRPPELVVVVDDAPGGDLTPAVVGRLARSAPVRYVEGARRGLADAHNRGLREVATPLVAFTDDDVVAHEEWLERLIGAFASTPEVGCVTGMIVPYELETAAQVLLEAYAGYSKGPVRRMFDLGPNRPADPLFPFAAGKLGSGANMAFTRMVLDELGGFDPALGAGTRAMGGDDLSAFFEVIQRGHCLVYEPTAIVRHRHARDHRALKRQVYGYGVGLTAYLTKCVLDRPRLLPVAARRAPAAARHVLRRGSAKNSRLPAGYPPELARLERLGMLAGPFAYVASRRRAGRQVGSVA